MAINTIEIYYICYLSLLKSGYNDSSCQASQRNKKQTKTAKKGR